MDTIVFKGNNKLIFTFHTKNSYLKNSWFSSRVPPPKANTEENKTEKDENTEKNENEKTEKYPPGSYVVSNKKNETILLNPENLKLISAYGANVQLLLKDCENVLVSR